MYSQKRLGKIESKFFVPTHPSLKIIANTCTVLYTVNFSRLCRVSGHCRVLSFFYNLRTNNGLICSKKVNEKRES